MSKKVGMTVDSLFPVHCAIGFRLDINQRLAVQLRLEELQTTLSDYMRGLIANDTRAVC